MKRTDEIWLLMSFVLMINSCGLKLKKYLLVSSTIR